MLEGMARVRIRVGEREVEVVASDLGVAESTVQRLWDKVGDSALSEAIDGASEELGVPELSVAELVAATKAQSGTEMVVVAAFYLERNNEGTSGFSTRDVSTTLAGARQKLSNPSYFVSNAVKQGLVMAASGKGRWQLTQSGLNWVNERIASSPVQSDDGDASGS